MRESNGVKVKGERNKEDLDVVLDLVLRKSVNVSTRSRSRSRSKQLLLSPLSFSL